MLSNSSKDVEVNKTKDEQVFGDKHCISYLIDPKTVEVSLSSHIVNMAGVVRFSTFSPIIVYQSINFSRLKICILNLAWS